MKNARRPSRVGSDEKMFDPQLWLSSWQAVESTLTLFQDKFGIGGPEINASHNPLIKKQCLFEGIEFPTTFDLFAFHP